MEIRREFKVFLFLFIGHEKITAVINSIINRMEKSNSYNNKKEWIGQLIRCGESDLNETNVSRIVEKRKKPRIEILFPHAPVVVCINDNNSSEKKLCGCFYCLTLNHKIGRKQSHTIISYQIYFNCGGATISGSSLFCECVCFFRVFDLFRQYTAR